ncbi:MULTISPECIES: hypothetical protein [unclassified Candidatus Tisiphia]|uniref:hypothetical protein n=1 Tax=unclassified Candidatus Tisiphia TaxID=2996318 RepID=UPI003CCB6B68
MSKNQDNASLISDETTEAERKKHEEFLAYLENVRAEFEEKSVEEIKESSILELAKYFCNDYLLIIKHQKQSEKFSDPQSSEEEQQKAYSYLDEHTESNIDKFITAFGELKIKTLKLLTSYETAPSVPFTYWAEDIKSSLNSLQSETLLSSFEKISDVNSSIGDKLFTAVLRYEQLLKSPDYQAILEKIINTEAETQKCEEFLAPLEDIRAKFEKKSVEEIKKSSVLELAQYFCAAYQLIEQYQIQSKNLSGSSNNREETKHAAYIYLQQHSKPDTDKFITAFDALKTKLQVVLNSNYGNSDINESFKTWIAATKGCLNNVQKEDFNAFFSEIPETDKSSIEEEVLFTFLGFKQFVEHPIYQESMEKIIITDIPRKQESTIEICDKELPEEKAVSNITEQILQILDNTLDIVPITGSNLDDNDLA